MVPYSKRLGLLARRERAPRRDGHDVAIPIVRFRVASKAAFCRYGIGQTKKATYVAFFASLDRPFSPQQPGFGQCPLPDFTPNEAESSRLTRVRGHSAAEALETPLIVICHPDYFLDALMHLHERHCGDLHLRTPFLSYHTCTTCAHLITK